MLFEIIQGHQFISCIVLFGLMTTILKKHYYYYYYYYYYY